MEKEIGKMQEKINCESTSVWVYDEDENVIYPFFCTGPKSQKLKQVVLNLVKVFVDMLLNITNLLLSIM